MARENQNECAGEEDEKVLTREVATPAAREDLTAVFSHPHPNPNLTPTLPRPPAFSGSRSDRPTARSIDGPHASSLSSPSIKQDAAATSPPLFIKLEMLQVGNPPLKSNIRKTGPCDAHTAERTMEYLGRFPIDARRRRLGLTLNCDGVSRVLKSGEEAILSSRVCRKTLWKSSISGRLPNRLSIWVAERKRRKR